MKLYFKDKLYNFLIDFFYEVIFINIKADFHSVLKARGWRFLPVNEPLD